MKPALLFAVAVALTATSLPIVAQTYQWKDSNGRTIVSDSPPPASARQSRTLPGINSPGKVPETPKSLAERDMEFKKRQQVSKTQADQAERENTANASRKENCELARRQIALLESGQRVAGTDEHGGRRLLDDAGREREKELMRQFLTDHCN